MNILHHPSLKASAPFLKNPASKIVYHHFILILLLFVVFSCQPKARDSRAESENPHEAPVRQPAQKPQVSATKFLPASGLYKGGLRMAVNGNTISGYFQEASGWNNQLNAPQFSCEYSFSGQYVGKDSIPLRLYSHDTTTGFLKILTQDKIRVTLSVNPCKNQEATSETWEVQQAYRLLEIKQIAAEKSYFYSRPDKGTRRKAYLVKGDRIEVTDTANGWYQATYHGTQSTTKGWINEEAFESSVYFDLHGLWISKAGEPYEVFYRFYTPDRYKTWSTSSFEPLGMSGRYQLHGKEITLYPCGMPAEKMSIKDASLQEITLIIPGTSRWTVFEKSTRDPQLEKAEFLIEDRQIMTLVNNKVVRIPSTGTKQAFLDIVCPFEIKKDVINRGEGTFDILRVSTKENGPLFYAIVDGERIISLVIDHSTVHSSSIAVGDTFAKLKKFFPSIALARSEIEGEIVGTTDEFTFTFGFLSEQVFNRVTKTIPDTVRIKQLIL